MGVGMTFDSSAITCIPLDELNRWHVMARIEVTFHCGCCRVGLSACGFGAVRPLPIFAGPAQTRPGRHPGPGPNRPRPEVRRRFGHTRVRHTSSLHLNNKSEMAPTTKHLQHTWRRVESKQELAISQPNLDSTWVREGR
jgi:hypothetical protein